VEGVVQLTIHIPDEVLAEYRHVLPPPELGLLEAVAIDAILAALERMANSRSAIQAPDSRGT
jgi:hypothetical protein